MAAQKACGYDNFMNRWLDCIQIWKGCSLGISDDVIEGIVNCQNTLHKGVSIMQQ